MVCKGTKKNFEKLSSIGFNPAYVVEVGVYHPETSNIIDYIQLGVRSMLVEPDPKSIDLIQSRFSKQKNVSLHPVAIYDFNGKVELTQRKASTFVSILPNSPATVNDGYKLNSDDTFVVEAKTFDRIDDGTIDLLSVDIEGSEWFVIKHMVSRPSVISLETHGAIYINPYLDNIMDWMENNGYRIWYKDKSDSVFVKNSGISTSGFDRVKLIVMNIFLATRRARKKLKKKVLIKNNC